MVSHESEILSGRGFFGFGVQEVSHIKVQGLVFAVPTRVNQPVSRPGTDLFGYWG